MTEHRLPTLDADGWELESAERRHAAHPGTFWIPARQEREALRPGDGAKLLFRLAGGTERMWVIVRQREGPWYVGVLDTTPAAAPDELPAALRRGTDVVFGPEHVADINTPPRQYVTDQYGPRFFED